MSPAPKSDELLEDRKVLSLVLLCTLIVLVVSGACFLTYWKGSQALRERGEWQFDHTLETLSLESEAALERWVSEMELWAKQPYMIRVLDEDVDNEIGESLEAVAQHSQHLRGLACVAIDGREIAFARSLGGPTEHAPISEENQRRYLEGTRGEVSIMGRDLFIRVPVFIEFGDRTVIGSLEALLDARALLPRAPLSWVTLRAGAGPALVEQRPREQGAFGESHGEDPDEEGWLRKTARVELPSGVLGPSLEMDLAQRHDSLFGQIPVLRALVVAISVCSSSLLLAMLVAFFTRQRNLMNRLSERATHLRDLNDVLKRSRLELRDQTMRAEAANSAKSDFLARMSHEIRTPMNGVIGASSALGEMDLSAEGRELTEIIGSSGELLLALIDDILDFSRIEAGKLELDQVPFELWALVDSTVLLAGSGSKNAVQLFSFPHADVPRLVEGDPTRLRQILINLIGNAVKFTARGEIRVDVRLEERLGTHVLLRFTVSDTGMGIPEQARAGIFDPFTQADRTAAQEHGGTGLGLAICKRLVEAMGGSIDVTSEVGVGSSFHFTARLKTAAAEEAPQAGFRSLLLITSSPTVAELCEHHCTSLGTRVTIARNAKEGEARLLEDSASDYDRILIDRELEDFDGMELVRIASSLPVKGRGLIVLQGMGTPLSTEEREELGVTVLNKPLRAREVLRVLAKEGPATEGPRPHALRVPTTRRARVLLAEDRLANQRVATVLLQRLGCHVDIARHGAEAVEAARRVHYDLILMDCLMPVMDGLEATREIRKMEGTRDRSTIIALTASALPSDQDRCMAAGMDGILTKPLRIEDLDVALRRWIRSADFG